MLQLMRLFPWAGRSQRARAPREQETRALQEQENVQNPNAACPLLLLPLDLLLCITDHLEEHQKILLSQQCRDLRVALRPRFGGYILLTPREQFSMQYWLTHDTADFFPSQTTRAIARANSIQGPRPRNVWTTMPHCKMPDLFIPLDLAKITPTLALSHDDCQLALKIMRLFGDADGDSVPQMRLKLFLNPAAVRVWEMGPGLLVHHTAKLRVADGRLLIHNDWIVKDCSSRFTVLDDCTHGHINICPHQEYNKDCWFRQPDEFPESGALGRALRKMQVRRTEWSRGRCDSCASDFVVTGSWLSCCLRSWTDLGPEDPSSPDTWAAFMSKARSSEHEMGAIQRAFESPPRRWG
ncbi:hypothetical protein HIM_01881 [Hirsutella minnesotensis 3608]|nr:hypothetical protein HIM_01881 [Hirsutella minnesotensis 3608]